MELHQNLKEKFIMWGLLLLGLASFSFYIYDPFYYPLIDRLFIFIGLLLLFFGVTPKKISYVFVIYLLYTLWYNYCGFLTNFSQQDFGKLYFSALIFVIFFILLYNITNKQLVIQSINNIIFIFIFINILSSIVFLLFVFKFPMYHKTIDLGGRGLLYENYSFLLIVCNYVSLDFGNFVVSRFNGVFEEPGMMGTYCGILLMVDTILFPNKNYRKFFLIFFGILSFSFAFYIFLFLLFLYRISLKSLVKITVIGTIAIFFLIQILPAKSTDYLFKLTIGRFGIENGKLAGDTRHQDNVKAQIYLEKARTILLLCGNGKDTNNKDKYDANFASYFSIIYETGFLGFLLFLFIHAYYLIFIPIKFQQFKYILLTIIPIISIYQGRQTIGILTILYFFGLKYFFENSYSIKQAEHYGR